MKQVSIMRGFSFVVPSVAAGAVIASAAAEASFLSALRRLVVRLALAADGA